MVPRSKASSSVLPYEVFLIIVEYLITGIEARQHGEIAWAYDRHYFPCKLVVDDLGLEDPFTKTIKQRYRDLRLPSQINQKSRQVVYQIFRPVPVRRSVRFWDGALGPILPVGALILPEVDVFVPYHAAPRAEYSHRESFFHQTIQPTILDLIQIIYLSEICSLSSHNHEALEALLALPNLKTITADVGLDMTGPDEMELFHDGRRPLALDCHFFTDLYYWRMLYGVIGVLCQHQKYIMEIFPSEDGTMIQYINPNCPCCPRPPTSERRKLAPEGGPELGY
ncbi:hypothetical protein CGLO_06668 [Colletotrichum gloeosporioides Cg-14]|uniref:Uncharacterized protein n=1 Tax=Colletotrichum gloeosporioides (strain Cg-14) TaxID=1237896 RepID=T0KNI0_COLGC|nr:hypothetical protein CGLO_06668 [Colletotrichum gloeosporioides Cg-14]